MLPILTIALLFAWTASFITVYIGWDMRDTPTIIAGCFMLVLTSVALTIH